MHSFGILDWERALLLEDDIVEMALLGRFQRFAGIPVLAEGRAASAVKAMPDALAPRHRQLCEQAGEIIARGEAVADEEQLERSHFTRTIGHAVFPTDRNLEKKRGHSLELIRVPMDMPTFRRETWYSAQIP